MLKAPTGEAQGMRRLGEQHARQRQAYMANPPGMAAPGALVPQGYQWEHGSNPENGDGSAP